jgi:hypothetical protein
MLVAPLPDRIRLPFAFDVARLREELERMTGGDWDRSSGAPEL